jgi:hypothetical protein
MHRVNIKSPLNGAIDFNDLTEVFKRRIFAKKNSSIMKNSL